MAKTKYRDPAASGDRPQINAKYASYKLEVVPSPIHRWGVVAGEFIPKGKKIIEYTGEKINRRETSKRADGPLNYLFTLNSYWTIDGAVGGSGAEFLNHCCEPSCYAWIYKDHILFMAGRDIQKGEELTIDYRFDPDVPAVKCSCGAANCRGTINLKKERKVRAKKAAAHKTLKKSGSKKTSKKKTPALPTRKAVKQSGTADLAAPGVRKKAVKKTTKKAAKKSPAKKSGRSR